MGTVSHGVGTIVPGGGGGTKATAGVSILRTCNGVGTNVSGTTCMVDQFQALGPYNGITPIYFNHDNASSLTVTSGCSAPAPTDEHDGTGLTWTVNTLSGASTWTVPAATGTYNTASLSPGIAVGDMIPTKSLARTDFASELPLHQLRTYYASGLKCAVMGAGALLSLNTQTGLKVKQRYSVNNKTTSPGSNAIAPYAQAGTASWFAVGIKFIYTDPVLDVCSIGDSTNAGTGSTSGFYNQLESAAKLSRSQNRSTIISPFNSAIGGQTAFWWAANARSIIASGLRPKIMLIPTWSINNGQTESAFVIGMSTALQIANDCIVNCIMPILLTPVPNSSLSGSGITYWLAQRNYVLSLQGQYVVCDMAESISDLSNGHYLNGTNADSAHPNDTGYDLQGVVLLNTLAKFM